jgi:hypothetical protein
MGWINWQKSLKEFLLLMAWRESPLNYHTQLLTIVPDAINDIFYQHDAFWAPKIAVCLGGIAVVITRS